MQVVDRLHVCLGSLHIVLRNRIRLERSMLSLICVLMYAASPIVGIVIPRQNGAPDPGGATVSNPGLQAIPASGKAYNTFSNGKAEIIGGFPYDSGPIPDVYQPRDIDIPFGRQFHGDLMMFPQDQLNDPSRNTGEYTPNVYDFANQSACGIPDNSYIQMKVAIHPYFLKYAGLDRKLSPFLHHVLRLRIANLHRPTC